MELEAEAKNILLLPHPASTSLVHKNIAKNTDLVLVRCQVAERF